MRFPTIRNHLLPKRSEFDANNICVLALQNRYNGIHQVTSDVETIPALRATSPWIAEKTGMIQKEKPYDLVRVNEADNRTVEGIYIDKALIQ